MQRRRLYGKQPREQEKVEDKTKISEGEDKTTEEADERENGRCVRREGNERAIKKENQGGTEKRRNAKVAKMALQEDGEEKSE